MRANTSRRELVAGGLESGKVVRVVGLADTIPFKKDDPFDASNRRISIIVMNRKTEEAFRAQGEEGVDQDEVDVAPAFDADTLRRSIEERARQPG